MSNMVVNTNVLALNSHRSMKVVGTLQSQASARLSSGMRVNSAADDAAGLAISEKMRSQIRGLNMASRNAQDGISLVQTAEGGLQEIGNMIHRIRELTIQAGDGINERGTAVNDKDTGKIAGEISQLVQEISSMAGRTQFNKNNLLVTAGATFNFQIGANTGQTISIEIDGISSIVNALTEAGAGALAGGTAQLDNIDSALDFVNNSRAKLGSYQNRLEYTIKSLDIASENLSASESRVRDADMAKEMMNLTKANVLSQAAMSMLAQANQAPQNILQLLR